MQKIEYDVNGYKIPVKGMHLVVCPDCVGRRRIMDGCFVMMCDTCDGDVSMWEDDDD